ncbi:MAG: amidohydrolase family protein [Proteobacteria bacterium]|nr:amidohydrolase family protein [Pseudomonadota bacterium]
MGAEIEYGLFDVDNHYYEPEEAYTRYLEPEYRGLFDRFYLAGLTKEDRLAGQEDWVVRPGSLKEYLRKLKAGEGEEPYVLMPPLAGFSNRDARISLMDEQGLEACTMFSSAVSMEHRIEDPNCLYAMLRALNRWIEDDWGYAYQDRIFCPAHLSLRDLDMAVAELDRVLAKGVRTINLRPGHAYGRSQGDPYFDPFWARVNEAKLSVLYHQGEGGHNEALAPLWGYDPNPHVFGMSAWQWFNSYGDAPVMAALSQLVYDNVFGRFPNILVASVENGAGWLPYFMSRLDKMRGMGRNGPWIGGPLTERPTEIAKRHVVVTPYAEDDVRGIVEAVGYQMLALGSDYPHAEGLAEPREFRKLIEHLPLDQQGWILRESGFRLVSG